MKTRTTSLAALVVAVSLVATGCVSTPVVQSPPPSASSSQDVTKMTMPERSLAFQQCMQAGAGQLAESRQATVTGVRALQGVAYLVATAGGAAAPFIQQGLAMAANVHAGGSEASINSTLATCKARYGM